MKIRKATKRDLRILADFWYEEEGLHKRFNEKAALRKDARKRIYNFIKLNIAKNNYAAFIAEHSNKVVGVLQGQIKKGYFLNNVGYVGHYSTIFIDRGYRQKGVAKKLFKAMTQWFKSKNIKSVDLYVHSKNKIALKAWKRLGFEEVLKLMRKVV